jgi:hypothetical protein
MVRLHPVRELGTCAPGEPGAAALDDLVPGRT